LLSNSQSKQSVSKSALEIIKQASLQGIKQVSDEISKKFDSAKKVASQKSGASGKKNEYFEIHLLELKNEK
jgi:hypothetical protein